MAIITTTTANLSTPPQFPSLTATTTKLFFHSSPTQIQFPKLTTTLSHATTIRAKPIIGNAASEDPGGGGVFDDESFFFGDEDSGEEEEEDEESESSVELVVRFVKSMATKVSKRAKKASRTVLPPAIPTQLVSFAVDGFMLLASLSILKALLQVVCNLGGAVFVSILLLRVIWALTSYFQSNESDFNQRGKSYGPAQPVS